MNIFKRNQKTENFLNESSVEKKCNISAPDAFQEMEGIINKIKNEPAPFSENFKNNLKEIIREKRQEKKSMNFKFIDFIMRPRYLTPLLIIFLLFSVVLASINLLPLLESSKYARQGEKAVEGIFTGFSDLIIPPALADANFNLRPIQSDSMGVLANSSYILTSKTPLDKRLIEKNIKIEPEIPYIIKEISSTKWEISPSANQESNRLFKVSLLSSYYSADGTQKERDYSWVYQIKSSLKIIGTIPGDTQNDIPTNTGIEINFSHDGVENFEKFFEISPKTPGRFEQHNRTMVFVPSKELEKSTIYQVTIKKGLPMKNSTETLANDFIFAFETSKMSDDNEASEWFWTDKEMVELKPSEVPIIQVSADENKNIDLNAKLFRFHDAAEFTASLQEKNKIPYWSYQWNEFWFDSSKLNKVSTFSSTIKKNESRSGYYFQFIEFPSKLDKGFYLLELSSKDQKRQVWLQITDLSAYIDVSRDFTLAWVNNLSTQKPVEGAEISFGGTASTSYKTDINGTSKFNTPSSTSKSSKHFVYGYENSERYENYRDYLSIKSEGNILIVPVFWGLDYEKKLNQDDFWSYLYNDRPLYQTTDTIKYWGLIRDRKGEKKPEKISIALINDGYMYRSYYGQDNNLVYEQNIEVSDFGTFSGELDIKDLKAGYYTMELRVNGITIKSKTTNISHYTKPAYKITLAPEKTHLMAGEQAKLKVRANFFEGTPVPNLKLKFIMPDGEYLFSTDEKGEADLTYDYKYRDCQEDYSCWPNYLYLSVTPEDSELADISGSSYLTFYGPDVYIEEDIKYPAAGQAEIKFTTKKWDLKKMNDGEASYTEDKPASNIKIKGEIKKIKYVENEIGEFYDFISKKKYKQYSYDRVEEITGNFDVQSNADGVYIHRQNIEPNTSYLIKIQYYDHQGKVNRDTIGLFYYNGERLMYYNDNAKCYPEIVNPKDIQTGISNYSVGEKINLNFVCGEKKMPAGEKRFLFTQMQNGLQEYSVQGEAGYEFSFGENDIPNVTIGAVYFNGNSYQQSTNQFDITYDSFKNKNIDIKVKTDKESYQPGENVHLTIQTNKTDGQATKSEVNINLIDEALYALMDEYASPLSTIYTSLSTGKIFSAFSHDNIHEKSLAEKGGCFAAGTKILMIDGTEKNIEDIKVGDRVASLVDPASTILTEGTVQKTWEHLVPEYLLINNKIRVTAEHQVFSNGRFTEAGLLQKGDWLLSHKGEKEIIRSIEKIRKITRVYNFQVNPTHTYFADGFYVHNEKGGGPRELFTDAALFKTIETDSQGKAEINFKLPDNITSWRVTAQAIGENLTVGATTMQIPVSLPAFIDVSVAKEYLVSDQPTIKLRGYGSALHATDKVTFNVKASSLGEEGKALDGTAFQATYYHLPDLKIGKHDFLYSMTTPYGNDAIKSPISVISSRLTAQVSESGKLSTATKITAIDKQPITISLSDIGQNELYGPLKDMEYSWGDRVDQTLSQKIAKELLQKYYQEDIWNQDFDPTLYQNLSGINLLPYSSEDLELSLKVALLDNHDFDAAALSTYFGNILDSNDSNREEISYALAGMMATDNPVLITIANWLDRSDLTIKEKVYIARGLSKAGAKEWARSIYREVLRTNANREHGKLLIRDGKTQDDIFAITASVAALGSTLNEPEAKELFEYVQKNQTLYGKEKNSENIFNLEKISYINSAILNLKPSPTKVVFSINDEQREVVLTGGETYTFQAGPLDVEKIKFTSIEGEVGISVLRTSPFDPNQAARNKNIEIKKEYYVNGQKTNSFQENDTVEVRLFPQFSKDAPDESYQITDTIPSGLIPISNIYRYENSYDCHYWLPYSVDERSVSYAIYKNWKNDYCSGDYIRYFARPRSKGNFTTEPTIIQSFSKAEVINYSSEGRIEIK